MEYYINQYFKALKAYCNSNRKEDFVFSKRLLELDKRDFIIFRIDDEILKSAEAIYNQKELIFPMDKIFIEIPNWQYEDEVHLLMNIGGILLIKETIGTRTQFTASTFWAFINKQTGCLEGLKPISTGFLDKIIPKSSLDPDMQMIGSNWKKAIKNQGRDLTEDIKKDICSNVFRIMIHILQKIEKKEYATYQKWTPAGYVVKEIVYSHDVMNHRRHFWKDSGKFKIPLMSKDEWESKGYGTDELVSRGRELRRDVPFKLIGQFKVGGDKPKKNEFRIINLFKKRILLQEEKIFRLLKEIYPDKLIRRHDRITLKGLELDFNLPELRLGIEYDGEQHFDKDLYEKIYGEGYEEQVQRDHLKDKLCIKKGIRLVRIKFDEPISKRNFKRLGVF